MNGIVLGNNDITTTLVLCSIDIIASPYLCDYLEGEFDDEIITPSYLGITKHQFDKKNKLNSAKKKNG